VHGAQRHDLQNQQIESPLQEIRFFKRRHVFASS
jgi:hypothetical protein